MDPLDQEMLDDIAEYGWHITLVPHAETGGLFAYTAGLTAQGQPELYMQASVPAQILGVVLNNAGEQLAAGSLSAGRSSDLLEGLDVMVIPMDHDTCRQAEMFASINLYGEKVHGLQLVLPDRDGSLPGDPTFTNDCRQVLWG